jgi:A/G-specific adenine glycosylase
VLVSEVMLQQTQASRVVPSYEAFLRLFPTVDDLAAASVAEVVRAWDGLGYNRRAVALREAAVAVRDRAGGVVPSSPDDLRRLPGVGPYTAAAIASIAYGVAVAAIDTNVRRVVTRAILGSDATPGNVETTAADWLDPREPGAWNQAVMDLGREVCRPRPRCQVCPLRRACLAVRGGSIALPAARRQPTFEGSLRQVRGDVIRSLRSAERLTLGELETRTGRPSSAIARAVGALARDGLVHADELALAASPHGCVELPR